MKAPRGGVLEEVAQKLQVKTYLGFVIDEIVMGEAPLQKSGKHHPKNGISEVLGQDSQAQDQNGIRDNAENGEPSCFLRLLQTQHQRRIDLGDKHEQGIHREKHQQIAHAGIVEFVGDQVPESKYCQAEYKSQNRDQVYYFAYVFAFGVDMAELGQQDHHALGYSQQQEGGKGCVDKKELTV